MQLSDTLIVLVLLPPVHHRAGGVLLVTKCASDVIQVVPLTWPLLT